MITIASPDPDCICYGNWRLLVKEVRHLIGRHYECANRGPYSGTYKFFGLVWGDDDLYYGMCRDGKPPLMLLSCVGSIEGHGFKLLPKRRKRRARLVLDD